MSQLELVANTVMEVAAAHSKSMDEQKAFRVAEIALKPAKIAEQDADTWLDVVVRGGHTNYGGAVAHYKAHARKWAA